MCSSGDALKTPAKLQTFADYERALTLAEALVGLARTDSPVHTMALELLLAHIEAYERAHYPHVSTVKTCLHCSTELAATCPHCHPDAWAHL